MHHTTFNTPAFRQLLDELTRLSADLETRDNDWPGAQFDRLAEHGVLGWVIPQEYGGADVSAVELMDGYAQLASACLTSTFILTQRNGACQRIAGSENAKLKSELLPKLAAGELFATVGISHLTTSRQHLKQPAIGVEPQDGGFLLSGAAPWVTGAKYADVIVTGGTLSDGRQILVALPTELPGVSVSPPPQLLALNESQTASVKLDNVPVDESRLIAGPVEQVMQRGKGGGAGSLTTSALAIGAAKGTLERLRAECKQRSELEDIYEPLAAEQQTLYENLLRASSPESPDAAVAPGADASGSPMSAASIRTRANSLVLRAAHAYLTAAKGAGFVSGHPAERAVREATFFLVWSCPQPIQTAALREFACVVEG